MRANPHAQSQGSDPRIRARDQGPRVKATLTDYCCDTHEPMWLVPQLQRLKKAIAPCHTCLTDSTVVILAPKRMMIAPAPAHSRISSFLAALLALIVSLFVSGAATAEINIAPLRQVLSTDGRGPREAVYEISNPSARIIDIRVSWMDLVATQDGYTPASAATRAQLSAAPYLTVKPAYLRLEPGTRAQLTLQLRPDAPALTGERRSHLLIETSAVRTPLRKAGGLQADVTVGITTPVILRGSPEKTGSKAGGETRAVFGDTMLARDERGDLVLNTHILQSGAFSAYGTLIADFEKAGSQTTERLATLDNMAVYPDIGVRRVTIALGTRSLPGGLLSLRFVGRDEYAGREFAAKSFAIAPPES